MYDTNYEPLWKCRICGSDGLLASTHAHCPNCSHERDYEATELPGWDELASRDDHRFTGTAFYCCDLGWSGEARHCGCCGDRLVHTAPVLRVVKTYPTAEELPELEVTLDDLLDDEAALEPTPGATTLVPWDDLVALSQGA